LFVVAAAGLAAAVFGAAGLGAVARELFENATADATRVGAEGGAAVARRRVKTQPRVGPNDRVVGRPCARAGERADRVAAATVAAYFY
jgi:hypothetical protein